MKLAILIPAADYSAEWRWAYDIEAQALAGTIECIKGDFCALPPGLGRVDLAFSIEAFVHAPSGDDYFRECARLIRPGGLLIVCDDFVADGRLQAIRKVPANVLRGNEVEPTGLRPPGRWKL